MGVLPVRYSKKHNPYEKGLLFFSKIEKIFGAYFKTIAVMAAEAVLLKIPELRERRE